MGKQVVRKNDASSCLSRWPAEAKHDKNASTVTTATLNNYKYSDTNMKTLNIRKFLYVAFGLLAVVLFGLALVRFEGLTVVGDFVGFAAALAILALAALDNTRTKKLV